LKRAPAVVDEEYFLEEGGEDSEQAISLLKESSQPDGQSIPLVEHRVSDTNLPSNSKTDIDITNIQWDPPVDSEAKVDIDISNVTWDKTFENHSKVEMLWGDDSSGFHEAPNGSKEAYHDTEDPVEVPLDRFDNTEVAAAEQDIENHEASIPLESSSNELSDKGFPVSEDTVDSSDNSAEEEQVRVVVELYDKGGILEHFMNKLVIMKAVSSYISLTEQEGKTLPMHIECTCDCQFNHPRSFFQC
jgi:hypothetical protein